MPFRSGVDEVFSKPIVAGQRALSSFHTPSPSQPICGSRLKQAPEWTAVDDYGLRQLSAHLYELRESPTYRRHLIELICEPWIRVKRDRSFAGSTSLLRDLDLTWDAVLLEQPVEPAKLVRIAAARQIAGQQEEFNTDTDLSTLTLLGCRDEAEARARSRQDSAAKIRGLLAIVEVLRERHDDIGSLLEGAVEEAHAIPSAVERAGVLSDLGVAFNALGDSREDAAFVDAEKAVTSVRDPDQIGRTTHALVVALTKAQRFAAAQRHAESMPSAWAEGARRDIAIAFAGAGLVKEAEQLAHSIGNQGHRSVALSGVAAAIFSSDPAYAAVLFDEAEALARSDPDPAVRAYALSRLAANSAQTPNHRSKVWFELAEEAAQALPSFLDRSMRLANVAWALAEAGKFGEAEQLAYSIPMPMYRSTALFSTASALAESGRFTEAGTLARSIDDYQYRSSALRTLARSIARAGEMRARSILLEAAESVNQHEFYQRVDLLGDLAVALTSTDAIHGDRVMDEALTLVRSLPTDRDWSEQIGQVAAALARIGRITQARDVIDLIKNDIVRERAHYDLAVILLHAGREDEAHEEARKFSLILRSDFASERSAEFIRTGQLAEARACIEAIERPLQRVIASCDLAVGLVDVDAHSASAVWQSAIEQLQTIEVGDEPWVLDIALRAIVKSLASVGGFAYAEQFARVIGDEFELTSALCDIAIDLVRAESVQNRQRGEEILAEAQLVALGIDQSHQRDRAIHALVTAYAKLGRFDKAEEQVKLMEGGLMRIDTEHDLADMYAEAGRLSQALETLRQPDLIAFIRQIIDWAPQLDQAYRGGGVEALREAIGVAGWVDPNWRNIAALMSA